MSRRRYSLPCLFLISVATCSAAIAETNQPSNQAPVPEKKTKPVKTSGHPDKSKTAKTEKADAIKPHALEGNMRDTMFSDPGVPVMSPASSPNPVAAAPKAAPAGAGAPSLSMKWHATTDYDPYYLGRDTSGPEGPGESVLGGIKFGF
jgi:hypothetical protein